MELELIRTYLRGGTNGSLCYNNIKICAKIELPWKNNAVRISCIPEGRYGLKKRWSKKFGDHYLLMDVPHRSLILIHPANNAIKELKGCIAPVTTIVAAGAGLRSREALRRLRQLINTAATNERVYITIRSTS